MEKRDLTVLIHRCMSGDRTAQEELVGMAQTRVYYHCRKMLKQEQDALDATQDVLLIMLTGLHKLRSPDAFWGWVNGITANHCKQILKCRGQVWQIPEDEAGNSMLDQIEDLDEQQVPEKALDNQETRRMILELVDSLPPEQRMCVLFYYYDQMSVKEIAQAMEVSEGTVKSRLNYARKSIKSGVERYEKQGIKLYGLSPLLLLLYFLRQDAQQGLPAGAAQAMTQQVLAAASASVTGDAATAAAGSAGTGTAVGISGKLVAGIVAAALVAGGGVAVFSSSNRHTAPSASQPSVLVSHPAVQEFTVLQPRIQRTAWDQPTDHTEIYFEIPVFDNATGGYAVINDFFQQRQDEFFSSETGDLRSALENDSTTPALPGEQFMDTFTAVVHDCSETVFSVTLQQTWYMGRNISGESEHYTFDPRTGDLLSLSDLVELSEAQLEDKIVSSLVDQYPGLNPTTNSGASLASALQEYYTMDTFKFYVEGGQIHIVFDKYDPAVGMDEAFDVTLTVPLKQLA